MVGGNRESLESNLDLIPDVVAKPLVHVGTHQSSVASDKLGAESLDLPM
jgi:hypothetical protein